MSTPNSQINDPSTVNELAQLATILIPFAYILGQQYAAAYFNGLGCGWAYKFLTFQETLTYSLPTALSILIGVSITLQLLFADIKYMKIFRVMFYVPVAIFFACLIANHYLNFTTSRSFVWAGAMWTCAIFGSYIADTLYLFKSKNTKQVNFSAAFVTMSSITIYITASTFGSLSAESDRENMERAFPKLNEGFIGNSTSKRLIAKVGDKYLISNLDIDTRHFQLLENINKYTISATPTKQVTTTD